MGSEDLISFSHSPPQTPITPRSTSSFHAAQASQNGWEALTPDRVGSRSAFASTTIARSQADEGRARVGVVERGSSSPTLPPPIQSTTSDTVSASTSNHTTSREGKNSIPNDHHHSHKSDDPRYTPSSIAGKNIPLPDSPYPSNKNDSDAQSIASTHSNETTQSKLLATAPAFNATPQKRIEVIRKSEPLSFYTSPADEPLPETPDVSPDQMDPGYFQPGYGGRLATSSASLPDRGPKSPVWFARAETRTVSITIPEPKVKVEKEVTRPSTPITVKTYDGTAESPISDRVIREPAPPSSPSEVYVDLRPEEEEVSCFSEETGSHPLVNSDTDQIPGLDQLTAHFGSISLTPADGPITVPPHPHPSSEAAAAETVTSELYNGKDGHLSPQYTGEDKIEIEPKEPKHPEPSDDNGQDTTLVSEGQLDFTGSLDDINDLEDAWMKFRDGYGQFSGSIDEALARLKMELRYADDRLSACVAGDAHVSGSPEVRLANARSLAFQSELRSARTKSAARLEELKKLDREIEDLVRDNKILEASANDHAIKYRIIQEEKRELDSQYQHREKRNQELMGKFLRLEEDYKVLEARSVSDTRDHFVVVLLEGDGRMFDARLLAQGSEGGRTMAIKLTQALGDLCREVLDTDTKPKIMFQLYIDIKETVEDLQKIGRIANEAAFQEFLSGFRLDSGLISVNLVEGVHGPGEAISGFAKFYANLPQCQMVIIGAGWNKPYRNLMEIKSRLFVDKFYALRSTTTVDRDPFLQLGKQKLLYVKHVFSTGVTEWRRLMKGHDGSSGEGGYGGGGGGEGGGGVGRSVSGDRGVDHEGSSVQDGDSYRSGAYGRGEGGDGDWESRSVSSYAGSSMANSRAASPPTEPKRQRSPSPSATPRAQRVAEPRRSNRLVSPDSSPTSRVPSSEPPWAYAPRPRQGGGSLLDQMLEAQSVSSRAHSPDSDGTVGPGHHGMVIPINSSEGSVGGSPPSSDSDRPSVAVPHSARKHVRRPLNYASADQDDETASEYSSV